MDWQEIVALLLVALVVGATLWWRRRRRRSDAACGSCGADGNKPEETPLRFYQRRP